MDRDKYLSILRDQLHTMNRFMQDTPDPRPHFGAGWWAGDMPYDIDDYTPENFCAGQTPPDKPVWVAWDAYLRDLDGAHREAMLAHYEAAKDLALGDLLAASIEASPEYWRKQAPLAIWELWD